MPTGPCGTHPKCIDSVADFITASPRETERGTRVRGGRWASLSSAWRGTSATDKRDWNTESCHENDIPQVGTGRFQGIQLGLAEVVSCIRFVNTDREEPFWPVLNRSHPLAPTEQVAAEC